MNPFAASVGGDVSTAGIYMGKPVKALQPVSASVTVALYGANACFRSLVVERLKAHVWRTCSPRGVVRSNPTFSAAYPVAREIPHFGGVRHM